MVENGFNNSSGNSAQIQIFNLESSKDPQQGQQLRNEIENLATKFIELDDKETHILREKKMIILEIADKFEQLKEINEYIFPITSICSDIYKYLSRKGYDISRRYVYEVIKDFAPQYSNHTTNSVVADSYQSVHSSQIDIKIEQKQADDSTNFLHKLNPKVLSRHQIQELIPKLDDVVSNLVDYAKEHDILLLSEEQANGTTPNYDADEADPFRDPVITDQPDPRPSTISAATYRLAESYTTLGKTVKANADMMVQYPPDTNDIEVEIKGANDINDLADFNYLLDKSIKGGTDRKYRRSLLQWAKISEDEDTWGKHAASSKNPYIAKFKDKEGNWKQEVRKLTREQIGDKSPKVRDFILTFKKLLPGYFRMMKWSEIYLHPFTNGESVKLSGKLSDRSLR